MISRSIFDETMYRLCYSETFNVCFFRSAGRLSNRSGAAAISFGGCLVFHFRYSVVDSAMRVKYSITYRTLVRQYFLAVKYRFILCVSEKNIDIPASICYNYYKTQGKYRKSSDKMVLSIVIHTGGKEYAGKFAAYGRMVRGIL